MIRRLRLKIIMLILLLSAVLLSIAAGAFYSATAVGLRRDGRELADARNRRTASNYAI